MGNDGPFEGSEALDPAYWREQPGVCGGCIAWRLVDPSPEATALEGECRLRPELTRVPPHLSACPLFKGRGVYAYAPEPRRSSPKRRHGTPPARVLRRDSQGSLTETPGIPSEAPVPREIDLGEVTAPQLQQLLRQVFAADRGVPRPMHPRFAEGETEVIDAQGQKRCVTNRDFFERLDHLKTELERLEDVVSGQDALLPQYAELVGLLRKAQGSLTTFNFLFEDRDDYFSGKL